MRHIRLRFRNPFILFQLRLISRYSTNKLVALIGGLGYVHWERCSGMLIVCPSMWEELIQIGKSGPPGDRDCLLFQISSAVTVAQK